MGAGLDALKANNDVNAGIRTVTARIETNRFFVHERCQNIINEFSMYSYAENEQDEPLKIHDHSMDSCRYAVMGLPAGGGESIPVENASFGGMPGFGGGRMPQLSLYERHEPGWTRNVKEKGKNIPEMW
ncbi:MAG: hypothetical protein IBX41_01255 [Methanophagales archaeon]|nr:hypothetical protein [Methanophagales archaeon]